MNKIEICDDRGIQIYSGTCYSNMAILRGLISGEIKKGAGTSVKFNIRISNGKDTKTQEWRPSTLVNCTAYEGNADRILKYYKEGDMVWIVGKFFNQKYNDSYYKGFNVREIIEADREKMVAEPSKDNSETDLLYEDLPF